ncbi:purple acid phosphatase family protein [Fodinibius salsisoli]|uniref:Metallophosphoesterase family protein n=1 Tax=Fodinibius salsisoli TaxID=2820877 RepID=A0ABT3PSI1_9BACT|nr:metallophosphoesterase family protein [Fodinibius salsisoli]MCW9708803.1 metallophosphoesterase family protein [Fodinibius salsisoli]
MKRLLILTATLVAFILIPATVLFAQQNSYPDRIVLNPLEDGVRGVAITWKSPVFADEGMVQWKKAQAHPVTDISSFHEKAAKTKLDTADFEGTLTPYRSFRVKLDGLNPATEYMYRVGHEDTGWSEWIQFQLPASNPDSTLTFIYMGDAQNDVRSQWSRSIRKAYSAAPEASFILYAGDLVNRGYNDREWNDWYQAGDFIHRMIPMIPTPGNHEYGHDDKGIYLSPLWRSHFTLPHNGPQDQEELAGTSYYVDYPSVRIISLDADQIHEVEEMRAAQARWLDRVLEENTKPWTIVTLHYPFYSTEPDRDNPKLRKRFKSILDRHQVDLVLQGHDHAYGRGMIDREGATDNNGTMYVVSVSGPKMYDLASEPWMQKSADNIQLYQVINIEQDQLKYKSYKITGELFDSFTLQKLSKDHIILED